MKTLGCSFLVLLTLVITSLDAKAQLTWGKTNCPVHAERMAVSSNGTVYATGYMSSGGFATYYSRDKGATWNVLTHVASALTCDSSGGVFYNDTVRHYSKDSSEIMFVSVRKYSKDFGVSYQDVTLPNPGGDFEASESALYFANDTNLWRSTDDGQSWAVIDTLPLRESLHCGNDDRVIVGFGSRWHYFEHGKQVALNFLPHGDTVHYARLLFIANDSFSYVGWGGCLYRIKEDNTYWECYDSSTMSGPNNYRPVVSSANILLEEDSASTRASYDHGTTWARIGDGTGEPFAPSSYQPQWGHDPAGNVYARRGFAIYRTRFFAGITENNSRYQFSIYPNPAEKVVTVSVADIRNVSVFDETGRGILSQNFEAPTSNPTINVERLQTGVYLIIARSKTEKFTSSFLKR